MASVLWIIVCFLSSTFVSGSNMGYNSGYSDGLNYYVDCIYDYIVCLRRTSTTDFCKRNLEYCSNTKISGKDFVRPTPEKPSPETTTVFTTTIRTTSRPKSTTRKPRPTEPPTAITLPPFPGPIIEESCDNVSLDNNQDGVYQININGSVKSVYCFWKNSRAYTMIQRRGQFKTPRNFFDKNWVAYLRGFGEPDKEHWLGLSHVHALTRIPRDLYIIFYDKNISRAMIRVLNFEVQDSASYYAFNYDAAFIAASDLKEYPRLMDSLPKQGAPFQTKDVNSLDKEACANSLSGGWWFKDPKSCGRSNLNGFNYNGYYNRQSGSEGIFWEAFRGSNYSLLITRMIVVKPRRKYRLRVKLVYVKDWESVIGEVELEEAYRMVIIKGKIGGLPGGQHSIHIIKGPLGKCGNYRERNNFLSRVDHLNSSNGRPMDLGKITSPGRNEVTTFTRVSRRVSLSPESPNNIIGRIFAVYDSSSTRPIGAPFGCGVIR